MGGKSLAISSHSSSLAGSEAAAVERWWRGAPQAAVPAVRAERNSRRFISRLVIAMILLPNRVARTTRTMSDGVARAVVAAPGSEGHLGWGRVRSRRSTNQASDIGVQFHNTRRE